MQEKDKQEDGFGPLGICHRLFNFIMNTFITRGTRSVTLGKSNAAAAPPHVDESPAVEESHKDQDEVIRPDDHELQVEFRHTNGSIVNRKKNISGQVLIQENKNSTKTRKNTDSQDQDKGNGGPGKATKRSTLTIEGGLNVPRRRPHLLTAASNINEKADAFIRSRKEAMEKTLSMNQATDV